MIELTLPTAEQIFGPNELDIIKKVGTKAAITDFAILLGGYVSGKNFIYDINSLNHRTGWYWTKTEDEDYDALAVEQEGLECAHFINARDIGARPILPYTAITNTSLNQSKRPDGILEVEYGYYPQWAPSDDYQVLLEELFKTGAMTTLSDYITTDSRMHSEHDNDFEPQEHIIYEYNKIAYIRIKANPVSDNFTLSNGKTYERDDYVWIEISPVKWLIDEETNIAISENILFSGVQFDKESNYTGDFSETEINLYMNTYFIKDLFKIKDISQNNINNQTREELLKEIKMLRQKLTETIRKNRELEKENISYKQKIRRIQEITKE